MNAKLKNNPAIGSTVDSLWRETGDYQEIVRGAREKIVAYDLAQQMKKQNVSSSELAKRMKTSRTSVSRLLDPTYDGATIKSLRRAAKAIGCKVELRLVRA